MPAFDPPRDPARAWARAGVPAAPPAPAAPPRGPAGAGGAAAAGASGRLTAAGPAPAREATAVHVVDDLLSHAVARRASDLHVEAGDDGATVRLRVDGVMVPGPPVPRGLAAAVASRLKILAGLDIADRLRPQDGRALVRAGGRAVELRVSSLPSVRGENLVVRLLDPDAGLESLERLGLLPGDAERFGRLLEAREGLVLVTGPTGSGKTTTLYAALGRVLARGGLNVITVENPVERRVAGVCRCRRTTAPASRSPRRCARSSARTPTSCSSARCATPRRPRWPPGGAHRPPRARHAPHVDAVSAVTRLADVGVESFKLAAALRGVVAQRLLRRLCAACRVPAAPGPADARLVGRAPAGEPSWEAAAPAGGHAGGPTDGPTDGAGPPNAAVGGGRCTACGGAGYRGRVPAVEVLVADAHLGGWVAAGAGPDALRRAAREGGTRSVWASAVGQVRAGATSVAELCGCSTCRGRGSATRRAARAGAPGPVARARGARGSDTGGGPRRGGPRPRRAPAVAGRRRERPGARRRAAGRRPAVRARVAGRRSGAAASAARRPRVGRASAARRPRGVYFAPLPRTRRADLADQFPPLRVGVVDVYVVRPDHARAGSAWRVLVLQRAPDRARAAARVGDGARTHRAGERPEDAVAARAARGDGLAPGACTT
jgi:type II secretory ATPase GspE/PulE/Tfp pilus assembly ATPase PilB-like protein